MLTIFQVTVKKFNQAWVNGGSNYGSTARVGYGEGQMPRDNTIKLWEP